jgi:serine/threonine protein kinase
MQSPHAESLVADERLPRLAGAEPIPGYRLVKPLGAGGYGEVWKCVAPGGITKAIKFVSAAAEHIASAQAPAELELAALQRFRDIRHPFLLSLDRLELVDNELVIVMELADGSLDELRAAHQDRGFRGIPRGELLALLAEAAEALDFISLTHHLQHLDIKPQNLLLVSRHIKIADFGLVQSLNEASPDVPQALRATPVYAAPETLEGRVSPQSDQYSLAIVYAELLTGVRPFDGKNAWQLMMQHASAEPELSSLPAADRATVRRALSKQPTERFATCLEFIQTLRGLDRSQSIAALSLPELVLPGTATAQAEIATPQKSTQETRSEFRAGAQPTEIAPDSALPVDPELPAGCEFLEYLGQNTLAEVWRARGPDGAKRLVRKLSETERMDAGLIHRLPQLRHPHVLPVEAVQDARERWYLISPDYTTTLRDRLQECRADGLNGIPRAELLTCLGSVASALDAMRLDHGIMHLGLNPRRIALVNDWTFLADLGLIQLFWESLKADGRHVLGRYDAPEVVNGRPGPRSDQYSLALLYVELLTGGHPRLSTRARSGRCSEGLDLDALAAPDRAVIRKALHSDPAKRFAGCQEFVDALDQAYQPRAAVQPSLTTIAPVVWTSNLHAGTTADAEEPPSARAMQEALVRLVRGGVTPCQGPGFRYLLHANGAVEHRFLVQLYRGGLKLRLQGFADQWRALLLFQSEHAAEYFLRTSRSLLQTCLGQQPGLRVRIEVEPAPGSAFHQGRILVWNDEERPEDRELVHSQAPRLLAALRGFLQARPELRAEERWPCVRPVQVYPVLADNRIGRPVEGQTRDLGSRGIGLTLPAALTSDRGYITLPGDGPLAQCALLAQIMRSRPVPAGGVEIGARFIGE